MDTPANEQIKPSLKLPKTKDQWNEANGFFHQMLYHILTSSIQNIDECITLSQKIVYNYFPEKYGTTGETRCNNLTEKYQAMSVK
jgi:hypothetical protein